MFLEYESRKGLPPRVAGQTRSTAVASRCQLRSAGRMAATPKNVEYGATYRVYTDSGDTHFKSQVDALRELVDNSVQYAPKGNEDPGGEPPKIEVVVSLEGRNESDHFVAVADNGCGMDEKMLYDFLQ